MKKLTFLAGIAALLAAPAQAQVLNSGALQVQGTDAINRGNPVKVVITDGSGTATTSTTVTGNAASGAADSGNPVKVGGVFNSTFPTLTNGQRADLQVDASGILHTSLAWAGLSMDSMTAFTSGVINPGNRAQQLPLSTALQLYDGTNLRAARGTVSGMYVQGPGAEGAASAGQPIGFGCVARNSGGAATENYTDGQRTDCQADPRGAIYVAPAGVPIAVDTANAGFFATPNYATESNRYVQGVLPQVYDGTNVKTMRGDTTGLYTVAKPTTSGGLSIQRLVGATSGVVKASAGQLYTGTLTNTNAAIRYLQIYNKATAGTLSTDTPVITVPLPPNSSVMIDFSAIGGQFTTGISWQFTTDDVAIPTTAGATTDIHGFVTFK